jgi:hypothetical protein
MPSLYFNGINGDTGSYLVAPREVERVQSFGDPREVQEGVDVTQLSEAGWGVIFAQADSATPRLRAALGPLLRLRCEQAGDRFYREFFGEQGYRAGESALDFMVRHGAAPGPVDPDHLPYYLLLVGDPQQIPYSFQFQLDIQYGVGRISFETIEEYERYAASVVSVESSQKPRPRRATFFGVRHPGDRLTELCADEMVQPLAKDVQNTVLERPTLSGWNVETSIGEQATKSRLAELLGGRDTPDILFTTTHGVFFPSGHERQVARQGALLCQDWPGLNTVAKADHYFCALDLPDGAAPRLSGLISFHVACFSAGVPLHNNFPSNGGLPLEEIARVPFVNRLPQRMLSYPDGGALAVIGHVDQAFEWSFHWKRPQLSSFRSVFRRLLLGYPVGAATDYLGARYAEINALLCEERKRSGLTISTLRDLQFARNDARNYAVIGDPAVRVGPRPEPDPKQRWSGALRGI